MRQLMRALHESRRREAKAQLQAYTTVAIAFAGDRDTRASYVDFLERVAEDGTAPGEPRREASPIINPSDAIRGLRSTLALYGQR